MSALDEIKVCDLFREVYGLMRRGRDEAAAGIVALEQGFPALAVRHLVTAQQTLAEAQQCGKQLSRAMGDHQPDPFADER